MSDLATHISYTSPKQTRTYSVGENGLPSRSIRSKTPSGTLESSAVAADAPVELSIKLNPEAGADAEALSADAFVSGCSLANFRMCFIVKV